MLDLICKYSTQWGAYCWNKLHLASTTTGQFLVHAPMNLALTRKSLLQVKELLFPHKNVYSKYLVPTTKCSELGTFGALQNTAWEPVHNQFISSLAQVDYMHMKYMDFVETS